MVGKGLRALKGGCNDFQYLDNKSSRYLDWWENVKKNLLENLTENLIKHFSGLKFYSIWMSPNPNFTPFWRPWQPNFTLFWRPQQPNFTPYWCPRQPNLYLVSVPRQFLLRATPGWVDMLCKCRAQLTWNWAGQETFRLRHSLRLNADVADKASQKSLRQFLNVAGQNLVMEKKIKFL